MFIKKFLDSENFCCCCYFVCCWFCIGATIKTKVFDEEEKRTKKHDSETN